MNEIASVRYIDAFGWSRWVNGDDYLHEASSMEFGEMVDGESVHMNEPHEANMVEICKGYLGVTPKRVQTGHLDASGFVMRTRPLDGLHHKAFTEIDAKPADYKMRIIECFRTATAYAAHLAS